VGCVHWWSERMGKRGGGEMNDTIAMACYGGW
jgi:hypothetical protein